MSGKAAAAAEQQGERCTTCSDEGVAMVALGVDAGAGLALCVDSEGIRRTVQTALVGALSAGDRVLVHAGAAIAALPAAHSPRPTGAAKGPT